MGQLKKKKTEKNKKTKNRTTRKKEGDPEAKNKVNNKLNSSYLYKIKLRTL